MATAVQPTESSTRFEIPRSFNRHQARELRGQVQRALRRGARSLIVDCGAWSTLDLSMLSALIQCATACREYGASFEVANLSSDLVGGVRELQLGGRLGLAD